MIYLPPSPRLLQLSSYLILSALMLIISASAAPQDNADYWLGEGQSSMENGSYKLAVSCFDRALKIDGANASAWGGKGIALSRLGRYKMAEMCLSFALKKDYANPDYWLEDGRAKEMGGKWSEAIESYEKALSLNESLAHAWMGMGNASLAMEKYEDARRFYRNALGQGLAHAGREGLLNALLAQGQDSLDRGSFEEAYSLSSEALALAPQDSRFSEIRCSALEGMGRTDDALSCYDQVLSSGQSSAKAKEAKSLLLTRLGKRELAAGNVSLALKWLEQARLLDPQNQDAAQFQA
ncbi:MAG: tetratricopeptide repeat protein, partial [Methanothrix sp.]|nr:tetratricopeptide repeat protein [Methanothrix sp.]